MGASAGAWGDSKRRHWLAWVLGVGLCPFPLAPPWVTLRLHASESEKERREGAGWVAPLLRP